MYSKFMRLINNLSKKGNIISYKSKKTSKKKKIFNFYTKKRNKKNKENFWMKSKISKQNIFKNNKKKKK